MKLFVHTVIFSPFQACFNGKKSSCVMDDACEEDSVCLSPLMMAVLQGDTPALENLIGSGGDVNECDLCYVTPLVQAIQKNNMKTVQILLHAGACPNGNPEGRLTPLQVVHEFY